MNFISLSDFLEDGIFFRELCMMEYFSKSFIYKLLLCTFSEINGTDSSTKYADKPLLKDGFTISRILDVKGEEISAWWISWENK